MERAYKENDNYKDNNKYILLKIVLESTTQLSYNDKGTEKRYHWNHFQKDFSCLQMLKTLTPNQNQSCYHELENLKRQMCVYLE